MGRTKQADTATAPAFIELEPATAAGLNAYRMLAEAFVFAQKWVEDEMTPTHANEWDSNKLDALGLFRTYLTTKIENSIRWNDGRKI